MTTIAGLQWHLVKPAESMLVMMVYYWTGVVSNKRDVHVTSHFVLNKFF